MFIVRMTTCKKFLPNLLSVQNDQQTTHFACFLFGCSLVRSFFIFYLFTTMSGDVTSEMCEKAFVEYGALFKDLRNEHPDWDRRTVTDYMYRNSDDFAAFFDIQPTFCDECICTDNPDYSMLAILLKAKKKYDEGEFTRGNVFEALSGAPERAAKMREGWQQLLSEYDDDTDTFFDESEKIINEARKNIVHHGKVRHINVSKTAGARRNPARKR